MVLRRITFGLEYYNRYHATYATRVQPTAILVFLSLSEPRTTGWCAYIYMHMSVITTPSRPKRMQVTILLSACISLSFSFSLKPKRHCCCLYMFTKITTTSRSQTACKPRLCNSLSSLPLSAAPVGMCHGQPDLGVPLGSVLEAVTAALVVQHRLLNLLRWRRRRRRRQPKNKQTNERTNITHTIYDTAVK